MIIQVPIYVFYFIFKPGRIFIIWDSKNYFGVWIIKWICKSPYIKVFQYTNGNMFIGIGHPFKEREHFSVEKKRRVYLVSIKSLIKDFGGLFQ